jgi:hypothetical protein
MTYVFNPRRVCCFGSVPAVCITTGSPNYSEDPVGTSVFKTGWWRHQPVRLFNHFVVVLCTLLFVLLLLNAFSVLVIGMHYCRGLQSPEANTEGRFTGWCLHQPVRDVVR